MALRIYRPGVHTQPRTQTCLVSMVALPGLVGLVAKEGHLTKAEISVVGALPGLGRPGGGRRPPKAELSLLSLLTYIPLW